MNALPILLLGGAALLMMGGKKNGAPKKLTGERGDVVVNGVEAYWILEHSLGGTQTRWKWVVAKVEDGEHIVFGDQEFATVEEAREDLRKTGISKGWKFKATKANGKTSGTLEEEPPGKHTGTPWFLMANYDAKAQVEERAKDCSNPQGFRAAVYPAIKKRLDEYRDDAIAAGNVGFGENEAGGIAFKSDLQMLVDNIFTVHCG